MKGYKVFQPDWTSYNGFQYEVGKTYEEHVEPICGKKGFYFCTKLIDCFNYYDFNPKNKVAEVEALGDVDISDDNCCTNKIKIIREINWNEALEIVNTGKGCTGFRNSGSRNSGWCNSGDHNSGDHNSGCYNSGSNNSGWYNSGWYNSGNRNSGNYNSGNYNSGYYNSGNRNFGWHNSGSNNFGNYNTGDHNFGNCNSGSHNFCDNSAGFFCTQEPNAIIFNVETNMTVSEFEESKYMKAMKSSDFKLTEWIPYTEEEMTEDENKKAIGGYLKKYTRKEAYANWWDGMTEENKQIIESMPNFNKYIFKRITGIDVEFGG